MMEPILTRYVHEPNASAIDFYLQHEGYDGLRRALAMAPNEVVEVVKASGLRGRGGAGFPTGLKWQFVSKEAARPKYLCCNADESEPGTFKDHLLLERNPHQVIEGCVIGCYAIGASTTYVYIRGEFHHVQRVLEGAIAEAYARGFLGRNILGSGFDCDVYAHRGAGAYEAGEETALIESIEGRRAHPRNKPPFPAAVGLYGCPTAVNNVETLSNVPHIMRRGADRFAGLGPEKNSGPKLYCLSGHVVKPGVYEAPMNITLRQLIDDRAGGVSGGRRLKAVIPGGSSTPILLPDAIDVEASFDGIAKAGSMLGSAAVVVLDETTCMVWLAQNLLGFYRHESCGKCTPCREGTDWLHKVVQRIERGEGQAGDIDLLQSAARNIAGKTLCPFGDAAVAVLLSTITHFRHEYEAHVREGRCPLPAGWRIRQGAGGQRGQGDGSSVAGFQSAEAASRG
jgi:NADH-quinone oxidoreductase subunit F